MMHFYLILPAGEAGPFTIDDIQKKIIAGEVSSSTLGRGAKEHTWRPLNALESTRDLFIAPPMPKHTKLLGHDPVLYASFSDRFAANQIDGFVSFVLLILAFFVTSYYMLPYYPITKEFIIEVMVYCMIFTPWPYFALMHSSRLQATIGKKTVGIKITDMHGERIGFLRATLRYFCLWLFFPFFFTFFMTPRRQMLHDLICGTVVVRRKIK